MTDIDIIAELEKKMNITIYRSMSLSFPYPTYVINYKKEVVYLGLNNCEINDRREVFVLLAQLKYLRKLNLKNNKLSNISFLRELKAVIELNLSENLISDISPLSAIENLEILNLNYNQLKNISSIENLTKLTKLSIAKNNIKHIPQWILNLDLEIQLDSIDQNSSLLLFGNPIETPPTDIIRQGKQAVTNYFKQLKLEEDRIDFLFEAKVLVIGEGGVGKTTFTKRVQNINAVMPKVKDTTLGIKIGKWSYSSEFQKNPKVIFHLNLWDFGGQQIYQGTHQIFFSDKSFYILITDTREQKTDFAYWLNTVEQLGGENSLLVIILNRKFGHEIKFDESGYRNYFGKFLKEIIELDLKKDKSKLVGLQEIIKIRIKQLSGIGDPLPPSWVKIRQALLKEKANFISFDRFKDICKKHQIESISMVETLSEYYNRIGVFTHFLNDPLLQERIYLNSNWLVKSVYKILDCEVVKSKSGRIDINDIHDIWHENELHYETSKLAHLMHTFGLMYRIPESDNYVVPAHLPTLTPYKKWPYSNDKHTVLKFIYEFDKYMPRGIMSRLIVALNHHIKDHSLVWLRGVNIAIDGANAEILESYSGTNSFEIKIVGNNKIELLSIIRERFNEVLAPFKKLKFIQQVPCICKECKESSDPAFHEYSLLMKFKEKGVGSQCKKTGEIVNVEDILINTKYSTEKQSKDIELTPIVIKIFLASSSELVDDREEFEIFINRENKRLNKEKIFIELNIWEDFIDAMSKEGLQSEYNKMIHESDIFICLLFTKVGRYTAEEFENAFQKFKTTGIPYVYTYFKNTTVNTQEIKEEEIISKFEFEKRLKQLGHFPSTYNNIEDLKYQFKMQLEKLTPIIFDKKNNAFF